MGKNAWENYSQSIYKKRNYKRKRLNGRIDFYPSTSRLAGEYSGVKKDRYTLVLRNLLYADICDYHYF